MNTNLISRKSEFRIFLLIALSGLLLRGLYLFEYAHFVNFDLAIGADIGEYQSRAQEILKGKFFPDTPDIHAPLYSFFLAALQKIGFSIPGIRIFQTLLNYFSWIALFFLLLKRSFPVNRALVFLAMAMCLAPLIFHPAELISESLLLPLMTCAFFSFHYAEEKTFASRAVFGSCAGVFSALALLTHGMLLGFLCMESIFLLWQKKWQTACFFILFSTITVAPFLILQSCHYGKTTGLQANTGFNIFLGNNPRANGTCYLRPGNLWRQTHFLALKNSTERGISTNRFFLEKAFDFWKKSPVKGIKLYFQKFLMIFSGKEYIAGADGGFLFCRTDTMNLLRFLTFPVFLLAFSGIWILFRKKEELWSPPLILAFSLLIMQILTVTSGRYRLLMFPGIIFLAAIGACHINWKKWLIPATFVFAVQFYMTYSFVGFNKHEGTALLGQAHFIKGNYEHAKELLLFAEKRCKDSSRIDNMLGNIAEKEGNMELARIYYQKVTKAEPFMPEGWMNLANVTPDISQADKLFRKAINASHPSPSADLLYNYANFLYKTGNHDAAEKLLPQIFNSAPDHIQALNLGGLMAASKKDFKNASAYFFRAARLKPDEPGYWKNTAITARLAEDKALEKFAAEKYMQLIRKKRHE